MWRCFTNKKSCEPMSFSSTSVLHHSFRTLVSHHACSYIFLYELKFHQGRTPSDYVDITSGLAELAAGVCWHPSHVVVSSLVGEDLNTLLGILTLPWTVYYDCGLFEIVVVPKYQYGMYEGWIGSAHFFLRLKKNCKKITFMYSSSLIYRYVRKK